MTFYIDSSENASADVSDAISVWDVEQDARDASIKLAGEHPGTIFYVRRTVSSSVLVFQAEATLTMDTQVISELAN